MRKAIKIAAFIAALCTASAYAQTQSAAPTGESAKRSLCRSQILSSEFFRNHYTECLGDGRMSVEEMLKKYRVVAVSQSTGATGMIYITYAVERLD
ncbi:hypothetical protein [Thiobacter aerophilum]|uniref:Uncharacterized protein n=1 Tax=Thiobacter aerophilum TaxID=3121275 RepID=A0ABV0EGA0_9BURK